MQFLHQRLLLIVILTHSHFRNDLDQIKMDVLKKVMNLSFSKVQMPISHVWQCRSHISRCTAAYEVNEHTVRGTWREMESSVSLHIRCRSSEGDMWSEILQLKEKCQSASIRERWTFLHPPPNPHYQLEEKQMHHFYPTALPLSPRQTLVLKHTRTFLPRSLFLSLFLSLSLSLSLNKLTSYYKRLVFWSILRTCIIYARRYCLSYTYIKKSNVYL